MLQILLKPQLTDFVPIMQNRCVSTLLFCRENRESNLARHYHKSIELIEHRYKNVRQHTRHLIFI